MKRLISRSYCILIAVCMSITSGVILAQSAPGPVTQAGTETKWIRCENGASIPGAYSHCALRIDLNSLKRGDTGELLGTRGFLRPLPILANVFGDSAKEFARGYRRAEMWHSGLVWTGAALIASSFAIGHFCKSETCKHDQSTGMLRNAMWAGAGVITISIPFRIRASRLSHKAIDVYNASLSR